MARTPRAVRAFDRPVYVADAALRLTTHKPDLGIGDPHDLGKSQHQAAFALPRQQHAIVQRHRRDANVQVDGFTSEGVAASSSWPFQLDPLVSKSAPIASTIPEEEATGRADTAMLRAEAAHPSCAYKRLERSLRPKLQGDLAAWFGPVPVVPAACRGNELPGPEGCKTDGSESFGRIRFWRTPVATCASQPAGCVTYYRRVTG